jgi:hypothetical protein
VDNRRDPLSYQGMFGSKHQIIQHMHHALDMVSRLPDAIHRPDLDGVVQVACLESFFVNVRLLAEFLVVPHPDRGAPKDFKAWDLTANWSPTPANAVERLRNHWLLASQQVVHFSLSRIQDPNQPEHVDTSLQGLAQIRSDVTAVYDAWLEQMKP